MNYQEYQERERSELAKQIRETETAPLQERREARAAWFEAMTDPALIRERLNWLLNGSYGKGAYDEAHRIKAAKRGNRIAQVALLLAALEWRCPANFAREAWNALNKAAQKAVNAAILDELDNYGKE